mmetsp:Transcript_6419/g.23790  ORF Transcript_6419/g.23790 Transcript_6419/m.23790 type:complete len:907 (+) Transcript_6419:586-3306(+)
MARAMTVSPQPESMFASGGGAASAPPLAVAPAPVSYPHEGVVSLKTQGSSDKFRERELLQQSLLRVKNYFTNDGKQVLVQVWYPVEAEGHKLLTTKNDDHFLKETHAGTRALESFREVSRGILFPVDEVTVGFEFKSVRSVATTQGLPGRVWLSQRPELAPSVQLYTQSEYARLPFAIKHGVQASFGMPLVLNNRPLAVLEVATMEKNFDIESQYETICSLLSSMNIHAPPANLCHRLVEPTGLRPPASVAGSTSTAALNILTDICLAYNVPLLQCWDAHPHSTNAVGSPSRPQWRLNCRDAPFVLGEQQLWHMRAMSAQKSFVEGEGAFGRLLSLRQEHLTNQLVPDLGALSQEEYPLRHFVVNAKLQGVMWCVCSTFVGREQGGNSTNSISGMKPFQRVLEVFLPRASYKSPEALHSTAWAILKDLREYLGPHGIVLSNAPLTCHGARVPDAGDGKDVVKMDAAFDSNGRLKLVGSGGSGPNNKRAAYPKSLNFDLLQKHFQLPLKDAAKALGVCTTTLKRACRAAGIKRWPSRKLKKLSGLNRCVKALNGEITWFPNGSELEAHLLAAGVENLPRRVRHEPHAAAAGTASEHHLQQNFAAIFATDARDPGGCDQDGLEEMEDRMGDSSGNAPKQVHMGNQHAPPQEVEYDVDSLDALRNKSNSPSSGGGDSDKDRAVGKAIMSAAAPMSKKEDQALFHGTEYAMEQAGPSGHMGNQWDSHQAAEWDSFDPFQWPDEDMAMLDQRVHGGNAVAEILGLHIPENGPQISQASHAAARPNSRTYDWNANHGNGVNFGMNDGPQEKAMQEAVPPPKLASDPMGLLPAVKLVHATTGDVVKFKFDSYQTVEKMRNKVAVAFGMDAQQVRFRYKDEEGDSCLIEDEDDIQEFVGNLTRGLPNRIMVSDS